MEGDYFSMVGLSSSITPLHRLKICGAIYLSEIKTPNPDLWCFFPDFQQALDNIKLQELTQTSQFSRNIGFL